MAAVAATVPAVAAAGVTAIANFDFGFSPGQ
jgi:hypothetical protein